MRSSNNELVVQRGETFSIDRTLLNKDGSPYIVSNGLPNPHLLITVSSSRYVQSDRYVVNYYLSLKELSRFRFTQVIPLNDLKNDDGSPKFPNGFADAENLTLTVYDNKLSFITAMYKGDLVRFELDDAVFSYKEGDKIYYKFWKPDELLEGSAGKWVDYSFRFVKTFDSKETNNWIEQTYYYSIQLVAGKSREDYLYDLCEKNGLKPVYKDYQYLYDLLMDNGINVTSDIINKILVRQDYNIPILLPTKISVLSNLERGFNHE